MRISQELYDEMLAHAREKNPEECCGIVSTKNGAGQRLYRITNIEASPLKFVMDPREQLRAYTEIDDAGLDLGAIYHSHTRSEPYPSQTDINFSEPWPGVVWIIVGLAGSDPEVRAYEISDGQVAEVELSVS
jgi:[CysO sulfur-carrier protein]-S-L-cysteine hydrolase